MSHKISLTIRADIDLDAIEIVATGCLTEQTAEVLLEQITRARMLDPSCPIRVDLTGAQHLDPAAVGRLQQRADARTSPYRAPLRLDLPDALPSCPLGRAAPATAS